ncbi:hypothetical protein QAD02_014522 [Eretmocerus hayati]|uniref:Uncharacterized protein n=1 Tax=Eretmocerus hayati TaxID=131215 RepID=A0ACC2PAG1_9HYME|nr:hypothetical protein QAD02_014522 [Eretmocerus hayati]
MCPNDDEKRDGSLKSFCHKLPKTELHAHLNGSLSKETLIKLHKMNYSTEAGKCENLNMENFESLTDVFETFNIAHSVTRNLESVYIATYDTIKEFYEDNVIYLELRSTPRAEEAMTKKDYILSILRAMRSIQDEKLRIQTKLLISVNRKQGLKAARENIHLAIELSKEHKEIVGIDLSGDPTKGDAFLNLLDEARKSGLKIAAHCAEVPNEKEAMDILKFKPDRLGHGTCIHPSLGGTDFLFETLLAYKIPVELCLTSNVKCKSVPNYDAHHFKYLYDSMHPICICTDDKGVFGTTLSRELTLAAEYFNLREKECANFIADSHNNYEQVKVIYAE